MQTLRRRWYSSSSSPSSTNNSNQTPLLPGSSSSNNNASHNHYNSTQNSTADLITTKQRMASTNTNDGEGLQPPSSPSHSSSPRPLTPPSYQRCEVAPNGSSAVAATLSCADQRDNNNNNENDEDDDSYNVHDVPIEITMNDPNDNNDNDNDNDDSASLSASQRSSSFLYNWRLYVPSTHNPWHLVRWLCVGGGAFAAPPSETQLQTSLQGLARCLLLLRHYLATYGMPAKGGVRDQEFVLREVIRDLYAGGAPLWALSPVMQKAAEGLTGHPNVNWQLFPRKAFVYSPSAGTTSMFTMERGFNIRKMDGMEKVAVRLATFASNVQAVSNIPSRFPNPQEFLHAARTESVRTLHSHQNTHSNTSGDPRTLAHKILNLASKNQGLFYYINSREYRGNNQFTADNEHPDVLVVTPMTVNNDNDDDEIDDHNENDAPTPNRQQALLQQANRQRPGMLNDFWVVTEEERELFSRLACLEAMRTIDEIDKAEADPANKQNPWLIIFYRVCASAGACAFWFNGSWADMLVAGILAVLVASIGTSSILSRQERIIYEVVASFIVGLTASLIALTWPGQTCFASMAIAGILDLLQGFRVVFSIIEIMSKHTVAGSADLMEGILFTGLIAYFLRFGQYVAAATMGDPNNTEFLRCTTGINEFWYLLLVPLAALSWSGLFNPSNRDLAPMAFHGVLAYGVNYGLSKLGASDELNNFVSASAVTLSAGILSRFTGRQAVGNTVAGMYVLLPGAYLVTSLYSSSIDGSFFTDIIRRAIIIGIGGWTGSILCSPALLGTTRGLLWQQQAARNADLRHGKTGDSGGRQYRDDSSKPSQPATMLYF